MKIKLFFVVLILCSSFQLLEAQQAERIQRGQRGYVPPPLQTQGTYIELKDPQQEIDLIIPKCEKAFGIDAFQKEILKTLITKKVKDDNAILEDEKNTRDIRKKKLFDREVQFYNDLGSIFTPDQVEDYKHMDFSETKEEKKEKKRKKKKKNKN